MSTGEKILVQKAVRELQQQVFEWKLRCFIIAVIAITVIGLLIIL